MNKTQPYVDWLLPKNDNFQQLIPVNYNGEDALSLPLAKKYCDIKTSKECSSMEILNLQLEKCPNNISLRLERADIFKEIGIKDKAISDYQYVLKLYPKNIIAKKSLETLLN